MDELASNVWLLKDEVVQRFMYYGELEPDKFPEHFDLPLNILFDRTNEQGNIRPLCFVRYDRTLFQVDLNGSGCNLTFKHSR